MSCINTLISIITVVYNGKSYIENTILSVIDQEFENYEYIIIDGGSTDGTLDIVKKYENKISVFISEHDDGIFEAMNKGLHLAKGEWVIFMNSGDCFYKKNTLKKIFTSNLEIKQYDLIYGDVCLYNDKDEYYVKSQTNKIKINLNAICHQSVFIRRMIHRDFNIKYKLCADHDIIYEQIKKGKEIYINNIISKILIGGVSSNLFKTRNEKFSISWEKGNLRDRSLAIIFYCYGTYKEICKEALIKIFPYKWFIFFRELKNKVEA